MKDYRRILAIVLTMILSICLFALPAMAATETASGLELSLVTDKAEYKVDEQIKASLTVKNTGDAPVSGLVVKHQLPENIKVINGDVEKFIPTLGVGESVSMEAVLKADVTPKTGDFAIAAVAAALVLSATGLVFLSKDAKVRKGIVSVFLCCVMIGSLAVAVPVRAESNSLTATAVVKVAGEEVTLTASAVVLAEGTYSVVDIAELTHGTVTADKAFYMRGETVTLTVTPDAGYFQKLYINGEPLMLDWKSKTYSFVAEEDIYAITGSFEARLELNASDWGRWDDYNQAHGVLTTYYPNNGDSWWMEITGEYQSITIKAKNYLPKEDTEDHGSTRAGYQQILRIKIKDKYYAFRLYNDKGQYAVSATAISNSVSGWGNWKALDSTAAAAVNGEGVDFKLERVGANTLEISVNGVVLITYTMEGVTEADKVQAVGIQQNCNQGQYVDIPFVLTAPGEEPPVEEPPVEDNTAKIQIPTLENGTVTADKTSCEIGETVTLTIAPAGGYFQKLYINGEPVILGWKTFTYTFTATESVMEITGSFERGANLAPKEWGRWDDHNQAHGILTTYYPNNGDSWWMDINGEYSSITVKAKNYLPKEETMDNNGNPAGYQQILRIQLDNGKYYAFRLYNDKGTYAVSATAVSGSVSGWGNWKALDSTAAAAVNGDGVDFKLERVGANTLKISVNGVVLITYTMEGVTETNKVLSVGIQQNCNQGQYVDIPFELG